MQREGIAKPLQNKKKDDYSSYVQEIREALEKRYSTRVNLNNKGKKGKIEFVYSSLEELDILLEKLGYEKSN
jgi:ParB family chromosome partitioning protein